MGACACVDSSSSQGSLIAVIDPFPMETTPNLNMPSPPFNEDSLSKKPFLSNNKTTSTNTLERTQSSIPVHDIIITEQQIPSKTEAEFKQTIASNLSTNTINIAICGCKLSGKSAFVIKFVENYFEKLYIPSISIEQHCKKMKYGRMMFTFNFWITPGERGYNVDYESVVGDAEFVFVFYDTSVCGSFDNAKELYEKEVRKFHSVGEVGKKVVFIGNKIDIVPRKESKDKIEKYCTEHMFKYFEISVKNATGIKNVFHYIVMSHLQLIESKRM